MVECGSDEGKDDAKCRPANRVSSETPKTWKELSPSEKKKAIADKNKANREGRQYGNVRFSRLKSKIKRQSIFFSKSSALSIKFNLSCAFSLVKMHLFLALFLL